MPIRNATYHDAPAIKSLLEVLCIKTTVSSLVDKLEFIFGNDYHQVLVYELKKEVVGFIAVHFLPQLEFEGELALVTHLAVDETVGHFSIWKALEEEVTGLARKRKCDQIQVYRSDRRAQTHQFYEQQGYAEFPKYFSKRLIYGK